MRNAALWVIASAMVLLVGGGGAYWYVDERRKSDLAEYQRLEGVARDALAEGGQISDALTAFHEAYENYQRMLGKAEGAQPEMARFHAERIDDLRVVVARKSTPDCLGLTQIKLVNALKSGASLAQYGALADSSAYRAEKAKVHEGFVSFMKEGLAACGAERANSDKRVKDAVEKMKIFEARKQ